MNQMNDIIAAGMGALIQDEDLKQAVLAYLEALIKAAKPERETWVKVWEEASQETRTILMPYFKDMTETRRLYLIARYDAFEEIATFQAYPVSADFEVSNKPRILDPFNFPVYRMADSFDHYTKVIQKAQSLMPEALAAWDAKLAEKPTEPTINEEAFRRL